MLLHVDQIESFCKGVHSHPGTVQKKDYTWLDTQVVTYYCNYMFLQVTNLDTCNRYYYA